MGKTEDAEETRKPGLSATRLRKKTKAHRSIDAVAPGLALPRTAVERVEIDTIVTEIEIGTDAETAIVMIMIDTVTETGIETEIEVNAAIVVKEVNVVIEMVREVITVAADIVATEM